MKSKKFLLPLLLIPILWIPFFGIWIYAIFLYIWCSKNWTMIEAQVFGKESAKKIEELKQTGYKRDEVDPAEIQKGK